jgi:hypothetical protein
MFLGESRMPKNIEIVAVVLFFQVVLSGANWRAQAQVEKAPYPAMPSLDRYLIHDKDFEIALARSGAPKSISDAAEVMVLGRHGYTTAVEGTNGFLCLERSWGRPPMFRTSRTPKFAPPFA